MKKLLFLFIIVLAFTSCYNYMNSTVVVKEIVSPTPGPEKYRVELGFLPYSQYFYTDSLYNVGDTLHFVRWNSKN